MMKENFANWGCFCKPCLIFLVNFAKHQQGYFCKTCGGHKEGIFIHNNNTAQQPNLLSTAVTCFLSPQSWILDVYVCVYACESGHTLSRFHFLKTLTQSSLVSSLFDGILLAETNIQNSQQASAQSSHIHPFTISQHRKIEQGAMSDFIFNLQVKKNKLNLLKTERRKQLISFCQFPSHCWLIGDY